MIQFNSLHAHICSLRTQLPLYVPVATDEKQGSPPSLFARSGEERRRAVVVVGSAERRLLSQATIFVRIPA